MIPPSFCPIYVENICHVCHVCHKSSHQLLKDFSLQALWPQHSPRRSLPAPVGYFQVVQYLRRKRLTFQVSTYENCFTTFPEGNVSPCHAPLWCSPSISLPLNCLLQYWSHWLLKFLRKAVKACRISMFDIFMFVSTSVRHKWETSYFMRLDFYAQKCGWCSSSQSANPKSSAISYQLSIIYLSNWSGQDI